MHSWFINAIRYPSVSVLFASVSVLSIRGYVMGPMLVWLVDLWGGKLVCLVRLSARKCFFFYFGSDPLRV
jgi:hypothetical protein